MQTTTDSQQLIALALNKDATRVLVGGRSVLKVFSVSEECGLLENLNLKSSKPTPTLDYSTLDVAWSPHDDDIVASSATNGSVLLFSVNGTSRYHQTARFPCHKRAVNKINFHPTDPYSVITASQDATVKILDTRVNDGAAQTFSSRTSDSVRDVQFCPAVPHWFAAGDDAGSIRIWDQRQPDRPYKVLGSAHNGPVLSIDFHPKHRFWLASAGRDKKITVRNIDMDGPESGSVDRTFDRSFDHQVLTIQAVNRIKWRPDRDYHIASSSLIMEHSVHVWDIRRPFIPFASFEEHKDTVTGIAWCDAKNFFTCGKDGMIRRHNFKEAQRPIQFANPVGLAIAPDGEIFIAAQKPRHVSKIRKTTKPGKKAGSGAIHHAPPIRNSSSRGTIESFFTRNQMPPSSTSAPIASQKQKLSGLFDRPFIADQFVIRSVDARTSLSMEHFQYLAKMYRLSGGPVSKLCLVNAQVCEELGLSYIQKVWQILSQICEQASTDPDQATGTPVANNADKALAPVASVNAADNHAHNTSGHSKHNASVGSSGHHSYPDHHGQAQPSAPPVTSTTSNDFFFGFPEVSRGGTLEYDTFFDYGNWKLEREAFEPVDPLQSATDDLGDDQATPTVARQASRSSTQQTLTNTEQTRVACRLPPCLRLSDKHSQLASTSANPSTQVVVSHSAASTNGANSVKHHERRLQLPTGWMTYRHTIGQMLSELVDEGCLQSAVCMMIVLGPMLDGLIDTITVNRWYSSYIDLLDRFELYTISTRIIKLLEIRELSQLGTQISLSCPKCNKQLPQPPVHPNVPDSRQKTGAGRKPGTCVKCSTPVAVCSVCQAVVRGLWVSCQVCSHGGHLSHMRNWFTTHNTCPTGCGHRCKAA